MKRVLRYRCGTSGRRLIATATDRPWWNWGQKLQALVGSDRCGGWDEPAPPTWWYRPTTSGRMARTSYPVRRYEIVADYATYDALYRAGNYDRRSEWRAICVDQDGDLILGRGYWGEGFHGLDRSETAILRRYLRRWRRADWWGARTWLWKQGLHASVYARKPGSCAAAPPKGSGGYDHWLCRLPRGHAMPHRFNAYTWEPDGRVCHQPSDVPLPDVAR